VPTVLVGVTALAAATSLPNAYAAVRLALDGHGAAVVSATFNSNTLNLIAGIAVPLLFVPGLGAAVPPGYILWLLAMSVLAMALVVRRLTRIGAGALLVVYLLFVVYAVVTA
jgi:cation:H+ antiporter